ncbi:MAG: VOC family protein [Acetobacteraceae bacterium]
MSATGLDHVGVAGADLDSLAAAFDRLGFRLTPPSPHHAPGPDGRPQPTGTGNRCAMLREGYLELIAVIDPARPSASLARMIARHAGIHILAFAIDDPDAELARLRAEGLAIDGIAWLERPIGEDGAGGVARFARLPLPDAPEGRIQLIRHLTPGLLWQPPLLDHPNRAVALEEAVIAVEEPEATLARLARLTGIGPSGDMIALPRGRVRVTGGEPFPGIPAPVLPFIAGVVLRTDDGAAAIRRLCGGLGRDTASGFLVPPEHAGGAALLFR